MLCCDSYQTLWLAVCWAFVFIFRRGVLFYSFLEFHLSTSSFPLAFPTPPYLFWIQIFVFSSFLFFPYVPLENSLPCWLTYCIFCRRIHCCRHCLGQITSRYLQCTSLSRSLWQHMIARLSRRRHRHGHWLCWIECIRVKISVWCKEHKVKFTAIIILHQSLAWLKRLLKKNANLTSRIMPLFVKNKRETASGLGHETYNPMQ